MPAPAQAQAEMRAPEPIDAPRLDATTTGEHAEHRAFEPADDAWPPAAGHDSSMDDAPGGDSAVDELRLAREELADALRRAGVDPEGGADDRPLQLEPQLPRPALFDDRAEPTSGGDDTAAYDALAELADLAGEEGEQPLWRDDHPAEDDPFLAELRRAVVDTEPLGPREHHAASPDPHAEDDDEDAASGGFFRRGKRKG
jgi:hypothetical protein